ncbi:hypothetical protein BpHYR1_027308 [Brachionus plicatilis]|uniref:SWIM-type domain-containing protein n=1 Tax=Brachionus plicatilis TaxID=10195 RepID=A0A3M7PSG2_BRAPC|nr:hypothetical protein BpHYR1_027308 [Brachionus plicatilis]
MAKFNSDIELEFYFNQFPKATSSHGNLNKCSICESNMDDHKMRVLYPHCRCSNDCQTRYLINKCVKTGQVLIKCLNPHVPVCPNISDETNKHLKKPGISKKYKVIIEDLIYRNIAKPYSIYQNILLDHGDDPSIPKLLQIQNFINYRRYRDGDINSIDGLLEHVTPRLISNLDFISLGKDESFYFGAEINEGSEEKHFHLGITSLALLSNLESRIVLTLEIPICSIAKFTIRKEAKNHLDSIDILKCEGGHKTFKCNGKHTVYINPDCFCPDCTNCTCSNFLDAAICIHLVGSCFLDSKDFPGILIRRFVSKSKTKKRKVEPWYEME